ANVPTYSRVSRSRDLSIDLGNGRCRYESPLATVPVENDYHKTLVVGFPSGGKRLVFMQMEALTGLPTRDEWDLEIYGWSNHPFIKSNYPHHEGIWESYEADQSIFVIADRVSRHVGAPVMRVSLAQLLTPLYRTDTQNRNCQHVVRTPELFTILVGAKSNPYLISLMSNRDFGYPANRVVKPGLYTVEERDFDLVVGNATVTPTYDPHCSYDMSEGCTPKAVISSEDLQDHEKGPLETNKIGNVLLADERTGQYVISSDTWNCIWQEVAMLKRAGITVEDRPGWQNETSTRLFSSEMLEKMLEELNYLIDKYSDPEWSSNPLAIRLVALLLEDQANIEDELVEVSSGRKVLSDYDFLGPKERERRTKEVENASSAANYESTDYTDFFNNMHTLRSKNKMKRVHEARDARRQSRMKSLFVL
ncbi:hypothetical protein THAOC_26298, partial [Thalassiosira oceanica]